MVVPIVVICPICGKKTYLRIQDGGYLREYPIRVHCMNCRTLIKGTYIMATRGGTTGIHLLNADIEDCIVDDNAIMHNADYVAEISGELPCRKVRAFDGNIMNNTTPFIEASGKMCSMQDHILRLREFTKNMDDWRKVKSTAFQLLNEGSIEFIPIAVQNKMGDYPYECDNYLKALHCMQEIVLKETKYLFVDKDQDDFISELIETLSNIETDSLIQLLDNIGGTETLLSEYRKTMDVFSQFMSIYANLLPAETYLRFPEDKRDGNEGIATCSFVDIKTFYQDAYESLLSLMYIPICLDNIKLRGDYQQFSEAFYESVKKIFSSDKFVKLRDDLKRYTKLDNGVKLTNINYNEPLQKMVDLPANKDLRNGIGHNNIKYDGLTQTITAFDRNNHSKVRLEKSLMDMAVDCIGLAKSSVIIGEIILFVLRRVLKNEGVSSIIHPRFYKTAEPNGKCPCGSSMKYKKCCRMSIDEIMMKK